MIVEGDFQKAFLIRLASPLRRHDDQKDLVEVTHPVGRDKAVVAVPGGALATDEAAGNTSLVPAPNQVER